MDQSTVIMKSFGEAGLDCVASKCFIIGFALTWSIFLVISPFNLLRSRRFSSYVPVTFCQNALLDSIFLTATAVTVAQDLAASALLIRTAGRFLSTASCQVLIFTENYFPDFKHQTSSDLLPRETLICLQYSYAASTLYLHALLFQVQHLLMNN